MSVKLKGSQTVETSLVLPVIIFIVVSFMYFLFYIHDKIIIDSCAYYSAVQSVFEKTSCDIIAGRNMQEVNLLSLKNPSVHTEEKRYVNVRYEGKFSAPLVPMKGITPDENVSEDSNAYQKIKVENMYVIKIVKDMLSEMEKE